MHALFDIISTTALESVKAHDHGGTYLEVAHKTAAGCCRHDVILGCYVILGALCYIEPVEMRVLVMGMKFDKRMVEVLTKNR